MHDFMMVADYRALQIGAVLIILMLVEKVLMRERLPSSNVTVSEAFAMTTVQLRIQSEAYLILSD